MREGTRLEDVIHSLSTRSLLGNENKGGTDKTRRGFVEDA